MHTQKAEELSNYFLVKLICIGGMSRNDESENFKFKMILIISIVITEEKAGAIFFPETAVSQIYLKISKLNSSMV